MLEQHDGSVLIESGQGKGRWGAVVLDPLWLLERSQAANFSAAGAAKRWNDTQDFSGVFVSTCTAAHEWSNMLVGGRLIYCPSCPPASPFAVYAMFQPENSSVVHPIKHDGKKKAGCETGYCGLAYFSPCGTGLPLTEADFSTLRIGPEFSCSMLPVQP